MKLVDLLRNLTWCSNNSMLTYIESSIAKESKIAITYLTANSINKIYFNEPNQMIFDHFDYIHPDGIGVFLATKFLFGRKVRIKRFTGSDFYPYLINCAIQNKWRLFFFGDELDTLKEIPNEYKRLEVAGYISGYDYNKKDVVKQINNVKTDILIVGLGQPKQECWIIENKSKLNVNVIIAVGDGIKVFSGTKLRGPTLVRKLGLEWFIRLVNYPSQYWSRYLIGIPVFIYKVIKEKIVEK